MATAAVDPPCRYNDMCDNLPNDLAPTTPLSQMVNALCPRIGEDAKRDQSGSQANVVSSNYWFAPAIESNWARLAVASRLVPSFGSDGRTITSMLGRGFDADCH